MPRFYCPAPLRSGDVLDLPAAAARHVQVLRLQPGLSITLFNHGPDGDPHGPGGEFEATITHMGRSDVRVEIGAHLAVERDAVHPVHLAIGMPANERMDWLVEKAVELGVASIQPLMSERSVLRLSGERALKKVAHWQSIAVAACEQCGGNRVPPVFAVESLSSWLPHWRAGVPEHTIGQLLSLRRDSAATQSAQQHPRLFLSGPEGGFSAAEETLALDAGFAPVSLGPRILRAETAALTALAQRVMA